MIGRVVIGIFAAAVVLTTLGFAQEAGQGRQNSQAERRHELALHRQQLEMEAGEAEQNFQQEMRELELEARRLDLEQRRDGDDGGGVFFVFLVAFHILLTVWVYQDIRKRNADASGLWIAITLLTGFFGALLYTLVRLGDLRQHGS